MGGPSDYTAFERAAAGLDAFLGAATARYALTPQLTLTASGGTAVKGLSGGVVSWGQNFMTLGAIHEL